MDGEIVLDVSKLQLDMHADHSNGRYRSRWTAVELPLAGGSRGEKLAEEARWHAGTVDVGLLVLPSEPWTAAGVSRIESGHNTHGVGNGSTNLC